MLAILWNPLFPNAARYVVHVTRHNDPRPWPGKAWACWWVSGLEIAVMDDRIMPLTLLGRVEEIVCPRCGEDDDITLTADDGVSTCFCMTCERRDTHRWSR